MTETTTETSAKKGLEVQNVSKNYSGIPVLRGVSVVVRPGEIVGLVGHNGAGKSTLLRTISGAIRPDGGAIRVDGVEQHFASPADAHVAGIGAVYQELSLLPNLTVMQNVFLGSELQRGGILQRAEMRQATQELTERFGLDLDPDRRVADYPVATRQLLEVAIATSKNARYLLLDEPTTSLEGRQVDRFLETVKELAAQGLGIILVDHKLDELYAVAHRIVALVDGELRIDASVSEVPREEVVQAIAGHGLEEGSSRLREGRSPGDPNAEPTIRAEGVGTADLVSVTLEARPGRILGLYGLVGSGRTEFLRAIAGVDRIRRGQLSINSEPYQPRSVATASRAGIAYVTEERKKDGIVPLQDSATNVMLPVLSQYRSLGFLQGGRIRERATELMDTLSVRGSRSNAVSQLSGGNQQKVVLARALAQKPRILLLDEPTKGVDLGVKAEIHQMIIRLAHEEGLTVIVVSSEEDEIIEVADDVVIFAGGGTDGTVYDANEITAADLREAAWNAA